MNRVLTGLASYPRTTQNTGLKVTEGDCRLRLCGRGGVLGRVRPVLVRMYKIHLYHLYMLQYCQGFNLKHN